MAMQGKIVTVAPVSSSSVVGKRMRGLMATATLTLFASLLVVAYLLPFASAAMTAMKARYTEPDTPNWPATPATFEYGGEQVPVYNVPIDGTTRQLALVDPGRRSSTFIDPANPGVPIEWEGRWRTLDRVWNFDVHTENFGEAYRVSNFGRLFVNTLLIAAIGAFGTVVSSIVVAYGFSRFRIPGKTILFMILISTIILPPQVTQIPTYTLFTRIGWTGTWLPLLVPHFFANAYNVFLLRQFFMGIPRDLDEAAMIDGASPLRTLVSVILPQAIPAVIAVSLFHFFWAWNDFFGPLIYLVGRPDLYPISLGIQVFNQIYAQQPNLVQATMMMAVAVPLLIFFGAQRFFMQGVVVTGVDK
jgi:multiple sugar transport system permease protein